MTVTALTALRRGRVGLHLDGQFICALHPDAITGLQPGSELDQDALEEVKAHSDLIFAKSKALTLLSVRCYTCSRLYEKLAVEWGETAAEAAVCRMLELGYLDDEDYARRLAAELSRKGQASGRIQRELERRGIDRETAREAVDGLEEDPEPAAARLVLRRYRNCLGDEKGQRRIQNALVRMGYRYDVIRAVLANLLEDEGYYDERE